MNNRQKLTKGKKPTLRPVNALFMWVKVFIRVKKRFSEITGQITLTEQSPHPRRPRGSQSGREKRRDESFQVRAALLPVLENFRPAFSPDPTDCPWISEDAVSHAHREMSRHPTLLLRDETKTVTAARRLEHNASLCSSH